MFVVKKGRKFGVKEKTLLRRKMSVDICATIFGTKKGREKANRWRSRSITTEEYHNSILTLANYFGFFQTVPTVAWTTIDGYHPLNFFHINGDVSLLGGDEPSETTMGCNLYRRIRFVAIMMIRLPEKTTAIIMAGTPTIGTPVATVLFHRCNIAFTVIVAFLWITTILGNSNDSLSSV